MVDNSRGNSSIDKLVDMVLTQPVLVDSRTSARTSFPINYSQNKSL